MKAKKEEWAFEGVPKWAQLLYNAFNQWLLIKGARYLFVIGGVIMMSQILTVVIDTLFRHTSWPNPFRGGALEIEELQMGMMAVLCLANTWYLGGHINIELLREKMKSRQGSIADVFAGICGVIFCANVSWGLMLEARNNLIIGLRTDVLQIPIGPLEIFFCATFLHFTLVLLDYTLKSAYRVYRPETNNTRR